MILVLPRRHICDAPLRQKPTWGHRIWGWVPSDDLFARAFSLLRLQRLFILALNTPSPFPKEGAELGDGNERTGDEAPSRRE
jgi:hypothetical protein